MFTHKDIENKKVEIIVYSENEQSIKKFTCDICTVSVATKNSNNQNNGIFTILFKNLSFCGKENSTITKGDKIFLEDDYKKGFEVIEQYSKGCVLSQLNGTYQVCELSFLCKQINQKINITLYSVGDNSVNKFECDKMSVSAIDDKSILNGIFCILSLKNVSPCNKNIVNINAGDKIVVGGDKKNVFIVVNKYSNDIEYTPINGAVINEISCLCKIEQKSISETKVKIYDIKDDKAETKVNHETKEEKYNNMAVELINNKFKYDDERASIINLFIKMIEKDNIELTYIDNMAINGRFFDINFIIRKNETNKNFKVTINAIDNVFCVLDDVYDDKLCHIFNDMSAYLSSEIESSKLNKETNKIVVVKNLITNLLSCKE